MFFTLYIASLGISAIVAALLAFFFWQRRPRPGAITAVGLMGAAVIISVGYILQYTNTTLSGQILATNIQYFGIASLPVLWLTFSLRYTENNTFLIPRNFFLLLIIPFITVVIVWTNGIDGLMYYGRQLDSNGPITIIAKEYGPWFWVYSSYSYLLYFIGTIILLNRLFRPPRLYRQQSIALLIWVIVPLAWNMVYIFNLLPTLRIDWTPSAFTVSGVAIAWGLFRFRLMDIIPIARGTAVEDMSDGFIVLDTQDRIVDINPAALLITEYPLIKVIGLPFATVFSQQLELVKHFNTPVAGEYFEIVIEKSSTQRYYELSISPIWDKYDHLIGRLVSLRDTTERKLIEAKSKDLEEKAHTRSRLAVAGEMAAGIAHEVNNPLATLLGYSDLLLKQDIPTEIRDDLEIIDRSAKRAANILDRMLNFTGQHIMERKSININHIIETAVEFRKHSLSVNGIDTIMHLDKKLPMILADGNQLQEVFLNLIINAENSMVQAHHGKRGKLIISTEIRRDIIHISFDDDGIGINKENLDKIFDPFFTTAEPGQGTGLGLSISQGIINGHGGEISVESEPSDGATFIIKLPIAL